jgi:hypothetical protein
MEQLPSATQIIGMVALGYLVGYWMGWGKMIILF